MAGIVAEGTDGYKLYVLRLKSIQHYTRWTSSLQICSTWLFVQQGEMTDSLIRGAHLLSMALNSTNPAELFFQIFVGVDKSNPR